MSIVLIVVVNLYALDHHIHDLRSKLPHFGIFAESFQKHSHVNGVLLGFCKLLFRFGHGLFQSVLLRFVVSRHRHKALVGNHTAYILLKQTGNIAVNFLDAFVSIKNSAFQRLNITFSPDGVPHFDQIQKVILIAADKIGDITDSFRHNLLKHHIPDKMNFAGTTRLCSWHNGRIPDPCAGSLKRRNIASHRSPDNTPNR